MISILKQALSLYPYSEQKALEIKKKKKNKNMPELQKCGL